VALIRCSLGAILLFAVLKTGNQKLPPRRLFKWLLLAALFNNAIPFTMSAWGEQTVPSSTAAVLNATTPIFAMLMTLAQAGGNANRFVVPGVLLGFSGVAMVVMGHDGGSVTASPGDFWRGVIFITIGALGYAIATLMAKKKLAGLYPIGLATTQVRLAAMMLLPVALAGPHPSELRVSSLAAVAGLGLAGSGF
jgi:drug/metabolite transporter (DMT)-like permease